MIPKQKNIPFVNHEQFRMTQLQVYNWGTFSGLHTIAISERGFLFVGPSGAGKSTLLDALSALLIPPGWVDFNAAARDAEQRRGRTRDRNFLSYIRGALGEEKDGESGEVLVQYLRPGTTWSALALTYKNSIGRVVTLVQLYSLRGSSTANTDVQHHYFVFDREVGLREFEEFGQSNFDIRKLKQTFPGVFSVDDFSSYKERFCRLLGIKSEMALKLLHKTQSAKNMGDLNMFFCDFMLDKPATFDVADRLVSEFGELNAAHQSVVTAKNQIDTLAPARNKHKEMETLLHHKKNLDELQHWVHPYVTSCKEKLLAEHIRTLRINAEGLMGELAQKKQYMDKSAATLRDLEQQRREKGGGLIEQWENEKESLEEQRTARLRKFNQAEESCEKLGWDLADSPQKFAEQTGEARQIIETWNQDNEESNDRLLALGLKKKDAEEAFSNAAREVEALKSQASNIPANMLELRKTVAEAIGVSEQALPFVGEMIEVKPDEVVWQGAIERILHGFALSLLVEERNYAALAEYVNGTPLPPPYFLNYHRIRHPDPSHAAPLGPSALSLKLNVKKNVFTNWLQAELRQHYNFSCVDSVQELRKVDRGVTKEGQIKFNKSRHEKDDRKRISDPKNWVLGSDNSGKRALFEALAQQLADKVIALEKDYNDLARENKNRAERVMQCQTLINLQWQEIDVPSIVSRIFEIDRKIKRERAGNTALQQIDLELEKQRTVVTAATKNHFDIATKVDGLNKEITQKQETLNRFLKENENILIPQSLAQSLDVRFAKHDIAIQFDNIDNLATRVMDALGKEKEEVSEGIANCVKDIEKQFVEFMRQWKMVVANVDTTIDSAPEYFSILSRLEADDLPSFEHRFFGLLKNQSLQNLTALSVFLNDARKEITERLELVNKSLSMVPFDLDSNQKTTFLNIVLSDRQIKDVQEFKQQIRQILTYTWNDDREKAESQFTELRNIVEKLSGQDPKQKQWRDSVLDVRKHVDFIGREIDEEGVEGRIYRTAGGKSGGERQKLATTCLAAALRYQLGGEDHGIPLYAPVILDEAFGKADSEFTVLAMDIFVNFGFQMVIATPLKSVMALEPFIGGACFIDILNRRDSRVLPIEYDADIQRLNLSAQAPNHEEALVE